MKKQIVIWLSVLLLCSPISIHASTSRILIRSSDLPVMFLIEVKASNSLQVTSIPTDLYIPNESGTLLSLQKEITTTALSRMEDSYHVTIDNYLDIDLDQIDADFHISQDDYDFTCMDGITSYFETVKDAVDITDILHYQRYISSDLNLNDYYSFYRMFQNTVTITYAYAPYFIVQGKKFPMDLLPIT